LEWSEQGVEGAYRFLGRTWRIVRDYLDDIGGVAPFAGREELAGDIKALRRKTHQTIKKVTGDIEERFHFNTAISAVMELVNALYQFPRPDKADILALSVVRETVEAVILLLAPLVPHVTEELWEELGHQGSLANASWPAYDPVVAAEEEITIVIQVNGKVRSRIVVPADEDGEKIIAMALGDEKMGKFIEGKKILKKVYVPKRLVNIVVNE
jgi:leucyl-tRNA synthetase